MLKYYSWIVLTFFMSMFLCLCLAHILYPGFIEDMEGNSLQHVARAAEGLPIYVEPSAKYIPLPYMPLYYYVSVPFYILFGDSFIGPRLVSSVCALLSGGMVIVIGWRESRSQVVACLAGALYFSSYRIMDAWLTCALPDALLLLLLLVGLYFLAYGNRVWHEIAWIVLFSLAFWTKQQGAIYFGFAVVYALFFRQNHLPRWAILGGILLGGPAAYYLLGSLLGDYFYYFTLTMPGRWERGIEYSVRRNAFILGTYVPISCYLASMSIWHATRENNLRPTALVWFVVTSFLSVSFTMMVSGSSNNHYMPFIASLSILAALGANYLVDHRKPVIIITGMFLVSLFSTIVFFAAVSAYGLSDRRIQIHAPLSCLAVLIIAIGFRLFQGSNVPKRTLLVMALVTGQFVIAFYYLPDYLPNRRYKECLVAFQEEMQSLDAPIIWVNYGNVPAALTGKKFDSAPGWVTLGDVNRQLNAQQDIERDLYPLRSRIQNSGDLYLLSNGRLNAASEWQNYGQFELVREYEDQFADLAQITWHWYSGHGYPRFLYRSSAKQ